MKKLKIRQLSLEGFKKYGSYAKMIDPIGEAIGEKPSEFFRDQIFLNLGQCNTASISTCRVHKRENIIDILEFHSRCGEAMIPLDGDILLQVAPATPDQKIPYDKAEVFLVPKGTAIVLNYGVWHYAPYAYDCDAVNIMAILPERTYANDSVVINLPIENQFEII